MQIEGADDEGNVVCPYCRYEYQPERIDEEGQVVDCDECGKSFHWVSVVSVTHRTMPDCALNGIEHDYVMQHGISRCSVCARVNWGGVK